MVRSDRETRLAMDTGSQLFLDTAVQIGEPRLARKFSTLEKFSNLSAESLLDKHQKRAHQATGNQDAIQLVESWRAEDAALSDGEQQEAMREWEELERLLDEEYLADNPLLP